MSMFFFILAITSAICGTALMVIIASALSKRGVKINYVFLRVFIIKYIHQYRELTVEETGKPGNLYYPFVISMNLAWVFAAIGIILKVTLE
jgi:hypothetical protein